MVAVPDEPQEIDEMMKRPLGRAALLATCFAALAAACNDPLAPGAPQAITELPRPLSAVERELLGASNDFAFALAEQLVPATDENLFFSPLSASMLLGMLLNGADGETYAQMRSALGWGDLTQEQINQAYADLVELLVTLDPTVEIALGNSVWTQSGFPVLPDFTARVEGAFEAETEEVSFADPSTLGRINDWASDATRGRIETIFDDLPANVVMVLLNAIYFKASWTERFDPERTEEAPFTRPDGSTVTADLMRLEHEIGVQRRPEATLVELPYGGGAFSMVLALPEEGRSAAGLLAELDADGWAAWMDGMVTSRAIVRVPRFELEWEAELNDALQALGITHAFGVGAPADFGRLTAGGGAALDLVKQKSYVRVDEEGTEAAAVTGGVMVTSAPSEIRFDRPFVFALRERLTGTILFMGVLHDPTE